MEMPDLESDRSLAEDTEKLSVSGNSTVRCPKCGMLNRFEFGDDPDGDYEGGPLIATASLDRQIAVWLLPEDGELTPEQEEWRQALQSIGVETYAWRPSDWPQIGAVLGERPRFDEKLSEDFIRRAEEAGLKAVVVAEAELAPGEDEKDALGRVLRDRKRGRR